MRFKPSRVRGPPGGGILKILFGDFGRAPRLVKLKTLEKFTKLPLEGTPTGTSTKLDEVKPPRTKNPDRSLGKTKTYHKTYP